MALMLIGNTLICDPSRGRAVLMPPIDESGPMKKQAALIPDQINIGQPFWMHDKTKTSCVHMIKHPHGSIQTMPQCDQSCFDRDTPRDPSVFRHLVCSMF